MFESPADNFAGSFLSRIGTHHFAAPLTRIGLFQSFPYLLPTLMAGVILIMGAVLACFLSWDGGVRGGNRITLSVEKNEPLSSAAAVTEGSPAPSHLTAVPSLMKKRSILSPGPDPEAAANGAGYPGLSTSVNPRRDSRASLGTAYGYAFLPDLY